MRNRARKNYVIYVLMLLLFGGLIYVAIEEGDRFSVMTSVPPLTH